MHECSHYIMLKILGVSVYGVSVRANGALIETEGMSPLQELISALAGPAGSFFLLLLIRWMPLLSLCAGIQGLFNLIPVLPFDGGRIVNSIFEICAGKRFPEKDLAKRGQKE